MDTFISEPNSRKIWNSNARWLMYQNCACCHSPHCFWSWIKHYSEHYHVGHHKRYTNYNCVTIFWKYQSLEVFFIVKLPKPLNERFFASNLSSKDQNRRFVRKSNTQPTLVNIGGGTGDVMKASFGASYEFANLHIKLSKNVIWNNSMRLGLLTFKGDLKHKIPVSRFNLTWEQIGHWVSPWQVCLQLE